MTAKTILITGARAPVALHLARLFHFAGHQVQLACSMASPMAARSVAVTQFHLLPSPRYDLSGFRDAVAQIVDHHQVDLIIPTCEEVFYLAMIKGDIPVPIWCPDLSDLTCVHDKFAFINKVRELGLPAPETTLLTSRDQVRDQPFDTVFKPQWSRFASSVLIKPSAHDRANITPTPQSAWVVQRFVEGDEISVYALANAGKIVGLAQYRSLYRAGKGAGICFAPIDFSAVTDFVARFADGMQWTGQISFDLIRQADGTIMPLECNPRATSGVHFFRQPDAFAQAVLGGPVVTPVVMQTQAVKLAMWVYGAAQAIKTGKVGRFWRTYQTAQDPLDWPDDPRPKRAQLAALREIAKIALRDRVSLQMASTHDIEWNGPDQSAI